MLELRVQKFIFLISFTIRVLNGIGEYLTCVLFQIVEDMSIKEGLT